MIDKLKFKRVRVEFRILLRKHRVQKLVGIITILHVWRDRHVVLLRSLRRHLHISDLECSNIRDSIREVVTSSHKITCKRVSVSGVRIDCDTHSSCTSIRLALVHVDRVVVAGVKCRVNHLVERHGFSLACGKLTKSVGLVSLKEGIRETRGIIERTTRNLLSEELELQVGTKEDRLIHTCVKLRVLTSVFDSALVVNHCTVTLIVFPGAFPLGIFR